MKIYLLLFIYFHILFASEFSDNRHINIVINNTCKMTNESDIKNLLVNEEKSIIKEDKIDLSYFFKNKNLLFILFGFFIYYISLFKTPSFLGVFVFIKDRIHKILKGFYDE